MSEHDIDFYQWINQQATLLKEQRFDQLDINNLILELKSISRMERRYLETYVEHLLCYLLIWRFSPAYRTKQLELDIDEQRLRIQHIFQESPSLEVCLEDIITRIYPLALIKAQKEGNIVKRELPANCPWSSKLIINGSVHIL